MARRTCSLRVFALPFLAALGFITLPVASAQAFNWDLEGKEITANTPFGGNIVPGTTLLYLIPAQNLVIHCSTFTFEEGTFRTDNTAHAKISTTGCTTKVKGVESAGCKPTLLPMIVKMKPILHGGRVLLLVESLTAGQPLDRFHFSEETCALPPLPELKGTFVFECYTGALVAADCKTGRVTQHIRVVSEKLASELGDDLRYSLNPAVIHLEAELFLSGAGDVGKTWAALI